MTDVWRIIDTGLRAAAQNIALDRALLEARYADEIPDTLRFYRYAPSVLVASRDCVAHECAFDYCQAAGIAIQRRLTAGDAQYCDGAQLAFALYLKGGGTAGRDMAATGRRVCHAVAAALNALGADACWRAPHEIVAGQRTLGSAGGVFEGDALLYQGTLELDANQSMRVRALRTPGEALGDAAVAAAQARVTDLKTELGRGAGPAEVRDRIVAALESEFGAEFQESDLSLTEEERFRHALAEIDTPVWVHLVQRPAADVKVATCRTAAGLQASVFYDRGAQRIKQVWFYAASRELESTVIALEAALRATAIERLERNIRSFFGGRAAVGGYAAADFVAVLREALQLPRVVVGYPGEPRS